MSGLLQHGDFTLHSGAPSHFKIDCDALTDEDVETAAWLISNRAGPFGEVRGIPSGGDRLAKALEPYATPGIANVLLVDDVWTTGGSMRTARRETPGDSDAWVIFSRTSELPWWCRALFKMDPW